MKKLTIEVENMKQNDTITLEKKYIWYIKLCNYIKIAH